MNRIRRLCSYLERCGSFADIGCDHGYCTQYMLENNLCEKAIISDISFKCLEKAEKLLAKYIQSGKVQSVCCSGLEDIDNQTDFILIAGMGGEEIINILKNSFIPKRFVLQPMKNVRAVREYLLKSGSRICVDEIFESEGKFYSVLKGMRGVGGQAYTDAQLEYGLNFKSAETRKFLQTELLKKRAYLNRRLNNSAREKIENQINLITGILNNEIK